MIKMNRHAPKPVKTKSGFHPDNEDLSSYPSGAQYRPAGAGSGLTNIREIKHLSGGDLEIAA